MSTRFRSLFLIILIPLLLNQCAQVAAPPGGPVDKTAPVILSSWPGRDSVNVKRSDRINIEFSESINKNSVEKAVFITPRQSDEPELKWKGNILSIILPDSFAENSTYIVNLGSSISDL